VNPKLLTQLQQCEDEGIPLAVVIGDGEIERKTVKIRNVATRAEVGTYRIQLKYLVKV